MAEKKAQIWIDNRARLMSAVLGVTDWPERAQQRKGHRAHSHARATSKWLAPYTSHPAIQGAQNLLNQNAPLEAFYSYAFRLNLDDFSIQNPPPWSPPQWNEQLGDLFHHSQLDQLWAQDQSAWERAEVETFDILAECDFYGFLEPFLGKIEEQLIYMPNISYPSDLTVGVRVGKDLICIAPPRIAWGDNEPWPFDEDPAHIYTTAISEYSRLLILAYLRQHAEIVQPITQKALPVDDHFRQTYPAWGDQFIQLFLAGCVAIFLEQHVSPQEAKSFILMERKLKGINILPAVISVLERYLKERGEGKFNELIDFLPFFPGHLKIANRVSSL